MIQGDAANSMLLFRSGLFEVIVHHEGTNTNLGPDILSEIANVCATRVHTKTIMALNEVCIGSKRYAQEPVRAPF